MIRPWVVLVRYGVADHQPRELVVMSSPPSPLCPYALIIPSSFEGQT